MAINESGLRRRVFTQPTSAEVASYQDMAESLREIDPFASGDTQLDGSVEFQVLHVGGDVDESACDFRDVRPVGSSPSESGAITVVQEHHDASGTTEDIWFLRGAGRDGEEIHAGYGAPLHRQTRYRIVMIKSENRR